MERAGNETSTDDEGSVGEKPAAYLSSSYPGMCLFFFTFLFYILNEHRKDSSNEKFQEHNITPKNAKQTREFFIFCGNRKKNN